MASVLVEKSPSPMKLEVLGSDVWPAVTHEAGAFTSECEVSEVSWVLDGHAVIRCIDDGEEAEVAAGDLVTLLGGRSYQWQIIEPVRRQVQP